MNIEQVLQKAGMSTVESKIYLVLLSYGSSTANDLAKLTDTNRSTAYVALEELVQRGLINIVTESRVKTYTACQPSQIISLLEERISQMEDVRHSLKVLLPELTELTHMSSSRPKIRYYEGNAGVRAVYEDTLTSHETIIAYASIDNMHEALPDYFPAYYQRPAANGIHIRSIHPDTPEARERVKHNKEEARDSVLVPKDKFGFSPEINLYDNKIAFMSLREKFGFIVESEELTRAMKKAFELSWIGAKKIHDSSQR